MGALGLEHGQVQQENQDRVRHHRRQIRQERLPGFFLFLCLFSFFFVFFFFFFFFLVCPSSFSTLCDAIGAKYEQSRSQISFFLFFFFFFFLFSLAVPYTHTHTHTHMEKRTHSHTHMHTQIGNLMPAQTLNLRTKILTCSHTASLNVQVRVSATTKLTI